MRPDQIGSADTIEALCDGVSSRRNQLLVDLGAELSLGAIDGAAEADWNALSATVTKLARTYSPFGPVLTEAVSEQLRKFAGAAGSKSAAIADRVRDTWQLGPGWVSHVSAELAAGLRDGSSTRGGSLGYDMDLSDLNSVVDHAVQAVGEAQGVSREHARHRWWRGCDGRLRCAGRAHRVDHRARRRTRLDGTAPARQARPGRRRRGRPTPTRTSTPSS